MLVFSKKREESGELEMDEWLGGRPTSDVLNYFITASLLGDKDLFQYALIDIAWRPDLDDTIRSVRKELFDTNVVKPWVLIMIYAVLDMWRRGGSMIEAIRSLDNLDNLENAIRFIASVHLPNGPVINDKDISRVANYLRYICEH